MKKRKPLLTILCGCCLLLGTFFSAENCSAQSLSPEVVAAQGDYFTSAGSSLSWTLGEIMGETYTGTGYILTQGFQQPKLLLTAFDNSVTPSFASVFSNPVISQLNVVSSVKGNFVVVDMLGQPVGSWEVKEGKTEINLSFLSAGIYHATLINSENNSKQAFKLSKTK